MDTQVTFEAFTVPEGNGPLDIRIVVPKSGYTLVAEDVSCYYLAPVNGLTQHAEVESSNKETTNGQ